MSDSDDTEVLLLIPPDFFLIETSRQENDSFIENLPSGSSSEDHSANLMSNNYFLHPSQQSELENINARLLEMEKNFSSDISTISNCTVKTRGGCEKHIISSNNGLETENFSHSTPKYDMKNHYRVEVPSEKSVMLKEIDSFLTRKTSEPNFRAHFNPSDDSHTIEARQPISLPNSSTICQINDTKKDNLISLGDIWNNDRRSDTISFQEERFRRQHCEKTIQALQIKLLEYQQKISVAIQVDKAKDIALEKQKEENLKLKSKLSALKEEMYVVDANKDEIIMRLKSENSELKVHVNFFENSIAQNKKILLEFQNKNQELENKVQNLTRSSSEIDSVYKNQIVDLENLVSNYKVSEKSVKEEGQKAKIELNKMMSAMEKSISEAAEYKISCERLQSELKFLREQKQSNVNKYEEEKSRTEFLEKQIKNHQQRIQELSEKEKTLRIELDVQKLSLKSHYQQQLEEVVSQKLKEFQSQLDSMEEMLKTEAKEREKLLAERAIKQIEMINEKSEQEISLLQQKHKEEVELYRIQLMNAGKKIEDLHGKVNSYKSKRTDMAKKIHNVMETQWQKALEILTNPSSNVEPLTAISSINLSDDKPHENNTERLDQSFNDLSKTFGTSKSSEEATSHDTAAKAHQLQTYIEMLLGKSPQEFEKLNKMLTRSKSENIETTQQQNHRELSAKRPWK